MASLLRLATELQTRGAQPGAVVVPQDPGLEQAARGVAGDIAAIGDQIGKLADHAAQAEGRDAGRIAGMDSEFRPVKNNTIHGDAYDQAGLHVAAARIQKDIVADFAAAYDQHQSSPKSLAQVYAAKTEAWKQKTIPELWPEAELTLQTQAFQHVRQATRNYDAKVAQEQQYAAQTQVHESLRSMSQLAYQSGLDEKADEILARNRAAIETRMGARDLRGNFLFTPHQRAQMLQQVDQEIAQGRIMGAYDRLTDLPAKEAFIKQYRQDYADGKGIGQAFDYQHFVRVEHALAAQYTKDKNAAGVSADLVASKVRAAVSDMEKGYPIAPDRLAGIEGQIGMLGAAAKGERLGEQVAQAKSNLAMLQRLQTLPPDELAAHNDRLEAGIRANTAREGDVHALTIARNLQKNQADGLKHDPLAWADRTGTLSVPRLDFSRQDVAEQLAERVARADQVARHYKLRLPGETADANETASPRLTYFYPEERQQLGALMAQGGAATLMVASALAVSDRAPQMLAELGKHAPTMALIGARVATAPGGEPPAIARDAADGLGLLKTEGFKAFAPGNAGEQRAAIEDVAGVALSDLPQTQAAAAQVAQAALQKRLSRKGEKDWKADDFKAAFREALGETVVDGQVYGGIYYQKDGFMGRGKSAILLPPNVRQEGFETIRLALRLEDLGDNRPQRRKAGGGTEPVDQADFARATFKTAGDGRYWLALGDPDGADPRYLLDARGSKFVVDLKRLEPVLRDRVPSAYLGGR